MVFICLQKYREKSYAECQNIKTFFCITFWRMVILAKSYLPCKIVKFSTTNNFSHFFYIFAAWKSSKYSYTH